MDLLIPADVLESVDCCEASSIGAPSGPVVTKVITLPWMLPLMLLTTEPADNNLKLNPKYLKPIITSHLLSGCPPKLYLKIHA